MGIFDMGRRKISGLKAQQPVRLAATDLFSGNKTSFVDRRRKIVLQILLNLPIFTQIYGVWVRLMIKIANEQHNNRAF